MSPTPAAPAPARPRRPARGPRERGVVAAMAAMFMSVLLLLALGTLSVGTMAVRKLAMQQAAESAAIGMAIEAQTTARPMTADPTLATVLTQSLNLGQGAAIFPQTLPMALPPKRTDFNGGTPADLTTLVQGQGVAQFPWAPIAPMVPIRAQVLTTSPRATVSQLTWRDGQLEPVIIPFIMILDYSGSTLLPSTQFGGTPRQWVQNVVLSILSATANTNYDGYHVDLGLIRFSDQPLEPPRGLASVTPVGWPGNSPVASPGSSDIAKASKRNLIFQAAFNSPADPIAQGTELSASIYRAMQMIQQLRNNNDPLTLLHTGRPVIMILTDGELSLGTNKNTPPQQYYNQCMANATAAKGAVDAAQNANIDVRTFRVVRDTSPGNSTLIGPQTVKMLNTPPYDATKNYFEITSGATLQEAIDLLTPMPHCLTTGLVPTPSSSGWTGAPRDDVNEPVYGFYSPSGGIESIVPRWGNTNIDVPPPLGSHAISTAPSTYAMYYYGTFPVGNSGPMNVVELNGNICQDYIQSGLKGTFQARWGPPQLVQ